MFLRIIFSFFSDLCGPGVFARVIPIFGCGSAALSSLWLSPSLLAAAPRGLTSQNFRQRSDVIDFLQALDQRQGAFSGFGA